MNKYINVVKKNIAVLVLGVLIGFAALLLVHLIPVEPMREHVYWSLGMIEKEFTNEVIVEGYNATLTGNFTDSLMLEHAVYFNEEHSILEQALLMYRGETYYDESDPEGWWPGQSLKDYVEGVPQPREVTYSRYWHGYLVVLKPLLFLISFNSIRLLNSAIQLILTGLVIIAFCKRGAYSLAKAFLVSLPFMFFISTFASLSLSVCFYIVLLTFLIQIPFEQKIYEKGAYATFFLVTGMVTSYFDFLTYPIITLVYPLCVYFYFHNQKWLQDIRKMSWYSLEWFIGYVGMWAGKWILADLLAGSTTIQDAIGTIFIRTQSAENATRISGFLDVILKNIQVYSNWCYIILMLLIVGYAFVKIMKQGISKFVKNLKAGLVFGVLALYPFVWYFVTQNHSEQHWQFTCRILAASVFAGIAGIAKIKED